MMTVQQVAKRILFRIGVVSLNPAVNANSANQTGIDLTNDIDEVVAAINGAYEEIWGLGPTAIREQRMSWQLQPPTSVNINVTAYSATISGLTDPGWMAGCTIRINGDGLDNELVNDTTLLRPFQGATGPVSATVFGDAVALPSTVANVLAPVYIPQIVSPLVPAASREQFQATFRWDAYGNGMRPSEYEYYAMQNKVTGEPRMWFAEPRYDPAKTYLPIFLRVNPMPGSPYPITARVRLKPPTITAADVGTYSSDPGTQIPQDWNESIVLPFAMQRFQMHPVFDGRPNVVKEIARQLAIAQNLLDALTPQVASVAAQFNR